MLTENSHRIQTTEQTFPAPHRALCWHCPRALSSVPVPVPSSLPKHSEFVPSLGGSECLWMALLLPSNGTQGQRAEMLGEIEMKQEFQLKANGWGSEAAISRNYHCVNVLQAAFFTVEYGVIFLVIHSLTSGNNQSCL